MYTIVIFSHSFDDTVNTTNKDAVDTKSRNEIKLNFSLACEQYFVLFVLHRRNKRVALILKTEMNYKKKISEKRTKNCPLELLRLHIKINVRKSRKSRKPNDSEKDAATRRAASNFEIPKIAQNATAF